MRLLVVSKFSHCSSPHPLLTLFVFYCSRGNGTLSILLPPYPISNSNAKLYLWTGNRQAGWHFYYQRSARAQKLRRASCCCRLFPLPYPQLFLSLLLLLLLILLTELAKRCWTAALTSSISNRNKTQHSKKDKCEKNAGLAASSCPPLSLFSPSHTSPCAALPLILVVLFCSPFVSYVRSSLCTP